MELGQEDRNDKRTGNARGASSVGGDSPTLERPPALGLVRQHDGCGSHQHQPVQTGSGVAVGAAHPHTVRGVRGAAVGVPHSRKD
eukprot:391117-Rhodomonas_salina.3